MKLNRLISSIFAATVVSSLVFAVNSTVLADGEGLLIDENSFPDENFRAYVSANIDNGDGVLSDEEISNTKEIDCNFCGIESLEGIEYFTALETLNCGSNGLNGLDLRGNPELRFLNCCDTHCTTLNVSKNTKLKELHCEACSLTSLNLKNNTKLTYLYCPNNKLTSLNVSKNTKLDFIQCEGNQLTKLDVSQCKNLTTMWCGGNNIKTLVLNKKLQRLICGDSTLEKLDISGCPALNVTFRRNKREARSKVYYYYFSEVPFKEENYFKYSFFIVSKTCKIKYSKAAQWCEISGNWYHMDAKGKIAKNCKKIGKYYYLFNSKGVMQKSGWKKDSKGNTYYLKKDGKAYTKKWAKKSGKWYYFGSNGKMVKGKSLKIGKKTYKFNSKGVCKNP